MRLLGGVSIRSAPWGCACSRCGLSHEVSCEPLLLLSDPPLTLLGARGGIVEYLPARPLGICHDLLDLEFLMLGHLAGVVTLHRLIVRDDPVAPRGFLALLLHQSLLLLLHFVLTGFTVHGVGLCVV